MTHVNINDIPESKIVALVCILAVGNSMKYIVNVNSVREILNDHEHGISYCIDHEEYYKHL